MNLGIDHGYYAIKTKNFSFPAGVTAYSHEPYTLQDTLETDGKFFVCGTGRQPILRDKTRKRQLLPADPGGYRQGAEAPRSKPRSALSPLPQDCRWLISGGRMKSSGNTCFALPSR